VPIASGSITPSIGCPFGPQSVAVRAVVPAEKVMTMSGFHTYRSTSQAALYAPVAPVPTS
jgi:hypothetical protein